MHYQIVVLSRYRAVVAQLFHQGTQCRCILDCAEFKIPPKCRNTIDRGFGTWQARYSKNFQGECCTRNDSLHTPHSQPPKNMPKEPQLTRKPRDKPKPYCWKPKVPKVKDAPKTSAKPKMTGRENLTIADWPEVCAYIDKHPAVSQGDIVKHFKTKKDRALVFTQGTLSRKLKDREKIKARAEAYPNTLSSKRERVVTRPDVERALYLWVRHMEENGETVNGPMLKEKRRRFEKLFNVPEDQCLEGEGWIPPFCKAHKIREHRRHGEAGSVNIAAVEAERKRMQLVLASYKPEDSFNFDESALLPL